MGARGVSLKWGDPPPPPQDSFDTFRRKGITSAYIRFCIDECIPYKGKGGGPGTRRRHQSPNPRIPASLNPRIPESPNP